MKNNSYFNKEDKDSERGFLQNDWKEDQYVISFLLNGLHYASTEADPEATYEFPIP